MTPTIRWARPHEGLLVRALLKKVGAHPAYLSLDWTQPLGQFWLVSTTKDACFEGCINVAYSQPIGRIEFLAIDPEVGRREKAIMIKHLCYAAAAALGNGGSQATCSYVNFAEQSWRKVLEKRRHLPLEDGTLYMWKVLTNGNE